MASGDILRMVEEAVGLEKAFFAGWHSSLVVVRNLWAFVSRATDALQWAYFELDV